MRYLLFRGGGGHSVQRPATHHARAPAVPPAAAVATLARVAQSRTEGVSAFRRALSGPYGDDLTTRNASPTGGRTRQSLASGLFLRYHISITQGTVDRACAVPAEVDSPQLIPSASRLLVLASNRYLAKLDARLEFGPPVCFVPTTLILLPTFSKKFKFKDQQSGTRKREVV